MVGATSSIMRVSLKEKVGSVGSSLMLWKSSKSLKGVAGDVGATEAFEEVSMREGAGVSALRGVSQECPKSEVNDSAYLSVLIVTSGRTTVGGRAPKCLR